jgi:hypothetical protein
MDSLVSALVYLIFLSTNIAIGIVMYRLGLHGQVRKMMKQMDDPSVDKGTKTPKEPSVIPGAEYNPYESPPSEFIRYYGTAALDDDEEEEEEGFVDDPVNPYRVGEEDAEE